MIPLSVHTSLAPQSLYASDFSGRTISFYAAKSKSEEMILCKILETLQCSDRSFSVYQKTREVIHLRRLGLKQPVGVRAVPQYRGGIFKLLWSPEIDSKESIPLAYVAWREPYSYLVPGPHRLFKNCSTVFRIARIFGRDGFIFYLFNGRKDLHKFAKLCNILDQRNQGAPFQFSLN
jgi:hypothetical protein